MDVKQLRYFMAVCNEGSLSAAAKSLYLTQPTLSRQMQELEREVGCDLFVRKSHSMELTDDGVRLRSRATEILDLVRRTKAEFSGGSAAELEGEISIGANETHLIDEIGLVAEQVRREHPRITFALTTGNFEALSGLMNQGSLDFGVFCQPVDLSGLNTLRIPGQDRWGVVARADDALARLDAVRRKDVIGRPLILSRQATNTALSSNEFAGWFGRDHDKINCVATTDLTRNALSYVRAGVGVLFTFEALAPCHEGSDLVFRPLDPPCTSFSSLAWKLNRPLSPIAEAFLSKAGEMWSRS